MLSDSNFQPPPTSVAHYLSLVRGGPAGRVGGGKVVYVCVFGDVQFLLRSTLLQLSSLYPCTKRGEFTGSVDNRHVMSVVLSPESGAVMVVFCPTLLSPCTPFHGVR
ncbi:hypothetical protein CBL_01382 [Carabus blaptoides fortunei]